MTQARQLILTLLSLLAATTVCTAQTDKYPFQRGDADQISGLSWSPNNNLIVTASGDDNALRLWDVKSGAVIWKTDVGFLQDQLELYYIRHSTWSIDQKFIATGTDNGKLQLWNAASGKLIWNIKAHGGSLTAVAISPDATMLVSAADLGDFNSELKVWNLANGKLIRDLSANQKEISAIRFIDANRFQIGNGFAQVITWSTDGFRAISTQDLSPCHAGFRASTTIVYSPDLSLLAAQCGMLLIEDVKTKRIVRTIARDEQSRRVSFSSNNAVLLLPDSEIFDLRTGTKREFHGRLDDGVLNHDGSLVAAFPSYRANGVEILDTRTGVRRHWLVGHPGAIKSLAFSSDGRSFVSGSADRIVRVWDTQSKTVRFSLEGHTGPVEWLEFGNNGRTLISKSRNETIVWDFEKGLKLSETKEERYENLTSRSLSASGKLALVEENDKPFRLVDAQTDKTLKEFTYIDQLDSLIFCPDEKHFLVKPWWSGWQLWSIDAGKPIREFELDYSFHNRVAFHPSEKIFITGGEDQNIFMFDLQTGKKIWSLFEIDEEEYAVKRAAEARRIAYIKDKNKRARLADIQIQPYKVYIAFDHYGDMTPLGQQRMMESDAPKLSMLKKDAAEATAIWLRLHNDSPLPISVPTQSMYLPDSKCFHEFPAGQKILGVCDNREISVWLGLEDKNGKHIPYGLDFGSSVILLPGKSVLFAVPIGDLQDGRAIVFDVSFQKPVEGGEIENYGNKRTLRFRMDQ